MVIPENQENKKRKSKVNNRKKEQSEKNLGNEYTTRKGKKVNKKESRSLKNCRRDCNKKIDDVTRMALFKDYWEMGNYDRRVTFIASLISIVEKKSETNLSCPKKNRQKTFCYFIDVKGERVQICKGCFCDIFGETAKFIFSVTNKKISSASAIPFSDKRRKHVPSNKISEEKMQQIYTHIKKFPSYESHYSRRHTEKRYLPSNLNKTIMYKLYK